MNEQEYLAHDWKSTPLGPLERWPIPLSCWSQFLRRCAQPALILWGDRRAILFNDAYAKLLGENYLGALGRSFEELSRPLWRHLAHYVDDAFAGNAGNFDDTAIPTSLGGKEETRFFSFSYTPIFYPGDAQNPIGVFCVVTDRTEKVALQTELEKQIERLHEVYEHAPGFIAMAEGPSHRFTFANASYRKLVGDREIIGRPVSDALPEVVEQGFIKILDEVYETGVPFVGRAIPVRLDPGPTNTPTVRYIDTIYHPMRSAKGKITGLFAEGHDVTEQVEAQSLAANLQSQLLRVTRSRAVESFGAAVAHEINQPLAAAVNYLGAAAKLVGVTGQEDELAKVIDLASAATLRSGEILRRLRHISSPTASPQRSDLMKIVIESIALTRTANPDLSIVTSALEPAQVNVDPVQIQQVLVNLIKNAQEAMLGSTNPRIDIALSKSNGFAVVSVRDRGGGIRHEQIEQLFDWFVTTKAEGTGIGLPISKRIIDAHHGEMWAANNEEGAVFSFSLPLTGENPCG